MRKEFTATTYIINTKEEKLLLIFHKKLQKWLPPGGHVDPNELPSETAIREAKEETGIDVALILQENVWVDQWNGTSFPRPYLCMLQNIPPHNALPCHQHMDFCYLARPVGGSLLENPRETAGIRWFTEMEIEMLESEKEIFEETKQVIRSVFNHIHARQLEGVL